MGWKVKTLGAAALSHLGRAECDKLHSANAFYHRSVICRWLPQCLYIKWNFTCVLSTALSRRKEKKQKQKKNICFCCSDRCVEVGLVSLSRIYIARGKYAALWGTCWLFMGRETDLKLMCDLLSLTCFTREHTRQRCIRSAKLLWILSSFVLVKCLVLETLADV